MKKKLLVLLAILAMVMCVFIACGEEEECAHQFKVTKTVAATCGKEGQRTLTCSLCSETKTETIAKLTKHNYKSTETPATCQAPGMSVAECTVCGHKTETVISQKLPNCDPTNCEVIIEKAANCTEDGIQRNVCKTCGKDVYSFGFESKIPKLGHTYERDNLQSNESKGITFYMGTCEAEGRYELECKEEGCGHKRTVTRDEYKELGEANLIPSYDVTKYDDMELKQHKFPLERNDSTEPTCTESGYDIYICEACGYEDKRAVYDPNGHFYVTKDAQLDVHYKITLAPTCQNPGTMAYICTVCGEVATEADFIKTVPIIDHNIVDDENVCELFASADATCTEAAYKIFTCSADPFCTERKTFTYGDPLGHDPQRNGEVNCSTEGLTPYKCSRCGEETLVNDEFSDLDIRHTYGSIKIAATCVDRAIFNCSICGKDYKSYDDDASGDPHGNHVYDVVNEVVPESCSAEGYTIYGCSAGNCGLTQNRDYVARINHTFNGVTEDGKIICAVCSFSYRDVTTEITTGGGTLCLGCEKTPCECGLKVEWNGYVSPKGPTEIKANEELVKNSVEWTEVEQKTIDLAIGKGMIILNGQDTTTYTVKVYDKADGELLATIEVSGAIVLIDLYKYEAVGQVAITASTDAEAYFYSIVK